MNLGRSLLNARRNRSQHGAAAVEFAIGALLLITMALGAGEFGLLLSTKHDLNMSVRLAGRIAATPCAGGGAGGGGAGADACLQGNVEWDDFKILRAIESGLDGKMGEVRQVIIYNVDKTDKSFASGQVPADCLESAAGIRGKCNIYTNNTTFQPISSPPPGFASGEDVPLLNNLDFFFNTDASYKFDELKSVFNCDNGPSSKFCPTAKVDGQALRRRNINAPASMGVFVRMSHAYATGFFGQRRTLSAWTMFQLEPHPLANDTLRPESLTPILVCNVPLTSPVDVANEGAPLGYAAVPVTLSDARSSATSLTLTPMAGTARSGFDYAGSPVVLSIPAGQTTGEFHIPIVNDNIYEGPESFTAKISSTANGIVSTTCSESTINITDNDVRPTVSVNEVTVTEGQTATFTVTLSAVAGSDQTVKFKTAGGTATSGADFTSVTRTITIPEGELSVTVPVLTTDDLYFEPGLDEIFTVELSDLSSGIDAAAPSDLNGKGTIVDNDLAPGVSVSSPTVTEGGAAVFRVTLTAVSSTDQTFNFNTVFGTALTPGDFTSVGVPTPILVTIPAGALFVDVPVVTIDDDIDEPGLPETFQGRITNLSAGMRALAAADLIGTASITDNDDAPTVSVSSESFVESVGTANFTLTLNRKSSQAQSVKFTTSSGTANIPTDAEAVSLRTVNIPANSLTATVSVAIVDDSAIESGPPEVFNVTLSDLSANLATTANGLTGTGTITDNDFAQCALAVSDESTTEGGLLTFTITLKNGCKYPTAQSVKVTTDDVNAVGGSDYTSLVAVNVSFPANSTSATFTVQTSNDATDEPIETFQVNLSSPSSGLTITGVGSDPQGIGEIIDNDNPPTVRVTDEAVIEGDTATFDVVLSNRSSVAQTVLFTTSNGTGADAAVAPGDYASKTFTVTIPANTLSVSVPVITNDDTVVELPEKFNVTLGALSSGIAVSGNDLTGIGTITDNDKRTISVSDASVTEGGTATFTLTLSGPHPLAQSINFTTSDGTAGSPADYTAKSVTVNFAANVTTATVTVVSIQDNIDEPNETFNVQLSNASDGISTASPSDLNGVGTIVDDDATPTVAVNDVTVSEGSTASFIVTLSRPSSTTQTVTFNTSNGTAVAPGDYTAVSTYTVTFGPGTTSKTVSVVTKNDGLIEGTENYNVTLSALSSGIAATGSDLLGIGTITDDDFATRSISINDVTVNEGNTATFTISLNGGTYPLPRTLTFTTSNGTATAGADYTAKTVTVTIPANTSSVQVTVSTLQDLLDEPNETFIVTLSNLQAGLVAGDLTGVGTINDDDVAPTVAVSDVSVTEGGAANFIVSLSAASGSDQTVTFSTLNGTAFSGSDYTSKSITVTIPAGQTSVTVPVATIDDSVVEGTETFSVKLTNPSSGITQTGSDLNGVGTIIDNDFTQRSVSVNDVTVTEGGTATFTLTLSGTHPNAQTVTFTTSNGSASAPGDFTARTTTVTFNGNTTSKTVTVSTVDDSISEGPETFNVALSNLSSGLTATGSDLFGVGTITDNDGAPTVSVNDVNVTEGGTANFTITLSPASSTAQSVTFTTSNGSALQPGDYTAKSVTVIIPANTSSVPVSVVTIDDSAVEGTENFNVTLSSLSSGIQNSGSDLTGVATIDDNDFAKRTVNVGPASVTEGATMQFLVSLTGGTHPFDQTVTFTTSNGSGSGGAVSPGDFTAVTTTVTIPAYTTGVNVPVPTADDNIDEPTETFTVTISSLSSGLQPGTLSATGTITDNDVTPTVRVDGTTVVEGQTATFNLYLSGPSSTPQTVNYVTSNDTAIAPGDYTAKSGTVTFAAYATTGSFTVTTIDDSVVEPGAPEKFGVSLNTLSSGINPSGSDTAAVGNITDNDIAPRAISVNDVTVNESAGTATFRVTLLGGSYPTAQTFLVSTSNGTAVAGTDYAAKSGFLVTVPANATYAEFTVSILNDTIYENPNSETFNVTLGSLSSGLTTTGSKLTGVGTITDDDPNIVVPPTTRPIIDDAN